MNNIVLMGRLTKDIEVNQSGKIASSSIAVDRRFKDANGNKVTDFFNVRWLGENRVKFAKNYLSKGMKILISGSSHVDQYKDNEGNNRSFHYVLAEETEFAESKRAGSAAEPQPPTDSDGFMNIPDGIDEELPFQ